MSLYVKIQTVQLCFRKLTQRYSYYCIPKFWYQWCDPHLQWKIQSHCLPQQQVSKRKHQVKLKEIIAAIHLWDKTISPELLYTDFFKLSNKVWAGQLYHRCVVSNTHVLSCPWQEMQRESRKTFWNELLSSTVQESRHS